MEKYSIILLSERLRDISCELEDTMKEYLAEPFNYPQDVVDEVVDIVDRLDLLVRKLECDFYNEGFRYGS